MQTIQNIVDQGDISLYGYNAIAGDIRENLNLSGSDMKYQIRASSGVLYLVSYDILGNETQYALSDSSKITINNFYVKILPNKEGGSIGEIIQNGFWIFFDIQTPDYQEEKRWYRTKRQMQSFLNIRKYD